MNMYSDWLSVMWSLVLVSLLLCKSSWTLVCHREEQFVKVEGAVQTINPIKTTTTAAVAFCTTECINFSGCNSFVFLTEANTDNCQLSANVDGESSTAVSVVYKKIPAMTVEGCASSPCLNGGTCEDSCYDPYYICRCPADKQGQHCEWDIAWVDEDWSLKFDNAGTHECGGTKTLMSGFGRSSCTELSCIETVRCSPVPIEYSHEDRTCVVGDWWGSFNQQAWNDCPAGHFVAGFMRAGGSELGNLEEGVCCKPPSAPDQWEDCYIEDIRSSFDEPDAFVSCKQPLYYITGIYSYPCPEISCMEQLRCCTIALP